MAADEDRSTYLVQARQPESGRTIGESHASMPRAVARAVELLQEGYAVEIRSDSSVASR